MHIFRPNQFLELRLLIFLFSSLCLSFIDSHYKALPYVRGQISLSFVPIKYLVNELVKDIYALQNFVSSKETLERRLKKLEKQNFVLRAQQQIYLALQQENRQLRALLNAAQPKKTKFLASRVLYSVSPNTEFKVF